MQPDGKMTMEMLTTGLKEGTSAYKSYVTSCRTCKTFLTSFFFPYQINEIGDTSFASQFGD